MTLLQLEGQIDNRDEIIESLRHENRRLDEALRIERLKVGQAEHGVKELRRLLLPLHRALLGVFGEIDSMGIADGGASPQSNPKWESWKQRLPGRPAEFIDLLLVHGTMTIKQFMAAAHCGQDSAYKTVSRLGQAGVTVSSGGRYSLKESV